MAAADVNRPHSDDLMEGVTLHGPQPFQTPQEEQGPLAKDNDKFFRASYRKPAVQDEADEGLDLGAVFGDGENESGADDEEDDDVEDVDELEHREEYLKAARGMTAPHLSERPKNIPPDSLRVMHEKAWIFRQAFINGCHPELLKILADTNAYLVSKNFEGKKPDEKTGQLHLEFILQPDVLTLNQELARWLNYHSKAQPGSLGRAHSAKLATYAVLRYRSIYKMGLDLKAVVHPEFAPQLVALVESGLKEVDEEPRELISGWLMDELVPGRKTAPNSLQLQKTQNAGNLYNEFFEKISKGDKADSEVTAIENMSTSLRTANKEVAYNANDHALPGRTVMVQIQQQALRKGGEEREVFVQLAKDCLAAFFEQSGYEIDITGSNKGGLVKPSNLNIKALKALEEGVAAYGKPLASKDRRLGSWSKEGTKDIKTWLPEGFDAEGNPTPGSRDATSSSASSASSKSPDASGTDTPASSAGSKSPARQGAEPNTPAPNRNSRSPVMQGAETSATDTSASAQPANKDPTPGGKVAKPTGLGNTPDSAPAGTTNTGSALDDDDEVPGLFLNGNTTVWGEVVESRKAGGGSRHIVNIGTTKYPLYRTYPGLHFGKGVGDTFLEQSKGHATDLRNKECSDIKTFNGIAIVERLSGNQNAITYIRGRWKDGSEEWFVYSDLKRLLGRAFLDEMVDKLMEKRDARMKRLDQAKKEGKHPDTQKPLSEEDRKLTPWLFPRPKSTRQYKKKGKSGKKAPKSAEIVVESDKE